MLLKKESPRIIKRDRNKLPGTIMRDKETLRIVGYFELPDFIRRAIKSEIKKTGYCISEINRYGKDIEIPNKYKVKDNGIKYANRAELIGRILYKNNIVINNKSNTSKPVNFKKKYYERLCFSEIYKKALDFLKILESKKEEVAVYLESYETYNVIEDEIKRSKDFLINLHVQR